MDKELFGDVISRYTDAEAVDDGFLVALDRRDRVSRPVFDYFAAHVPDGPKPPDGWPVEIMGWFKKSKHDPVRDVFNRVIALAKGLLGKYGPEARRIYEGNIGGGIWKIRAVLGPDRKLAGLSEKPVGDCADPRDRVLWLLPNELGGLTLMFPEDY